MSYIKMNFSRRDFIRSGMVIGTGIALSPDVLAMQRQITVSPDICIFSKCLQFLDYQQLAEIIAKMGLDGVDLTVRKNGHVVPENVKTDLPRAFKAFQGVSKKIPMIVTEIVDANDRYTDQILSTASSLGIKYYRIGYFRYDPTLGIIENLNKHRQAMEDLEKINRKYKIHGCYQNHSGPYNFVGGPVWDLHHLIKDMDPEFIGVQYDIMHATVEGGYSWPYGLKLVAPWIRTIDMKDFIWEEGNSGKWETKIIPMGEGMVDFNKFIKEVEHLNIQATYSIHCEYDLGGAENGSLQPKMKPDEIYKKIGKDLSFLQTLIKP